MKLNAVIFSFFRAIFGKFGKILRTPKMCLYTYACADDSLETQGEATLAYLSERSHLCLDWGRKRSLLCRIQIKQSQNACVSFRLTTGI